jgi:sugar O-acyltransferase (sialic acid O-acetyltransferase NeuD family)
MEDIHKLPVIVIGAGGLGKTIVSVLQGSGYNAFGILDDNTERIGKEVLGVPILGPIAKIEDYTNHGFVMGVSDNQTRKEIVSKYSDINWIRVQSTAAYVNPTVSIGVGTVIFAGAVIGADVTLGSHVIASANITIGHDAIIGDYAHVAPGVQIAGAAKIGSGSMLGMACVVCPEVELGENVILGAGAVAVSDIPSGSVAFGMPARVRKKD